MMLSVPKFMMETLIRAALAEDIGSGDVTTASVLTGQEKGHARVVAKSDLVVAGGDIFGEVFLLVDDRIQRTSCLPDGMQVQRGQVVAEISGPLAGILMAERVALNFFQRMCGIATATRQYVEAVSGTKAKILDTRKTVPGLRILDKYAVRIGGGTNHRFGLGNCILIKENHIEAAGGIGEAVSRTRQAASHTLKIEVEVKNFQELDEALAAGADIIMLDNMSVADMRKAVRKVNGRVPLEASGNVTLATVRQIAETGVDFISSGALTHSVKAADLSLLVSSQG
ncbi:MAG: putative nicotinate-nucleotide pyrophosphorylase (carboxylating) [Syntrophus sp. PtaU1.Bin005]|jgi:nicotinate-nucleotide pyrophosphorylase (carboxylating)|uniref:carboxylating nicotinate-nucleotide diphosphorylase n=1 Tax=Syntrophus TaxID=43773 RepID=UPI0009CAB205|nr:MAG: putative nicotinate-nucleotide pyrophosphorylase (carboxylating) [Syntrophus sp. PtaB.Bin138]OPY80883.1 MAG: putative nicotinate-nucleotide pyrophosphorylase (carboxylating) [Syntrophus sp. PtaU1.Bin005]